MMDNKTKKKCKVIYFDYLKTNYVTLVGNDLRSHSNVTAIPSLLAILDTISKIRIRLIKLTSPNNPFTNILSSWYDRSKIIWEGNKFSTKWK